MEYIIHSAPSFPLHLLEDRDAHRRITLHDRGEMQAGYLSLTRVAPPTPDAGNSSDGSLSAAWGRTIIADLIEDYLSNANNLLPIVSREELEANGDGLLGYTAALVAATRTECPVEAFRALRNMVNKEIIEQGR